MPVSLIDIGNELLPGLGRNLYLDTGMWRSFPGLIKPIKGWVPSTPAIIIPKVSVPVALAMGVGAAVIRNPIVSRRFWRGWSA